MTECRCGAEIDPRRSQPGDRNERVTEHYRCPNCDAGGFRVVEPSGEQVRAGGPAFREGSA